MKQFTYPLACAFLCTGLFTSPMTGQVEPELTRLEWGSLSIYTENDKYLSGNDRYYTNGFAFNALSSDLRSFTDGPVPAPVKFIARRLGRLVPPGREYKLGLGFGQNIYTPADISVATPLPDDRPYAAWLYFGTSFQIYEPPRVLASGLRAFAKLDVVTVQFGMVGPAALGRQIQNGVHRLLDIEQAQGWANQIYDEPGILLSYERKYRFATRGARTGWGVDFIPHAGLSLSNIFTYANFGAEARVGYRLPADFGTNLIRPTGQSNSPNRPRLSVFLFAAADARAVARDITLDGNTFRDSPHVNRETFVADYLVGVGLGTRHWQFSYSQAERTREFEAQVDTSIFGSFSVSFFY